MPAAASAPIIAGVDALAGNAGSVRDGSFPYAHAGALHDITSGSNGSCGGGYLCTAMRGYDGPSGLGTPDGSGAFQSLREPQQRAPSPRRPRCDPGPSACQGYQEVP